MPYTIQQRVAFTTPATLDFDLAGATRFAFAVQNTGPVACAWVGAEHAVDAAGVPMANGWISGECDAHDTAPLMQSYYRTGAARVRLTLTAPTGTTSGVVEFSGAK